MCCSIPALKWIIYVCCVLVLGVGCVLVWAGYIVQSSEFIKEIQFSYSGFIIIACGGVLLFIAFIGIVGALKQNTFLLGFFLFFSIIIGGLLVTFGIVLIFIRSLSNSYLKDYNSCISHFNDTDYTSMMSSTVFCELYCPCLLNSNAPNNFYKGSADNMFQCNPCENIQTYSASQQNDLISWIKNNLYITVNASNCQITSTQYQNNFFGDKYSQYLSFVTWTEKSFGCSGLCTSQSLFMFSDANAGNPIGPCYRELRSWVNTTFLNYGIISIVFGSYLVIILIFTTRLCCNTKRKLEKPSKISASPIKTLS